jgi:hypothetical protein
MNRARRRWVVAATLLVGAVSLALTLRLEAGDARFLAGAAWMAAVWAVGAWLSGPLPHSERGRTGAALGTGVLAGALAVVVCAAGGLVAARVPGLREPAEQLLAHAGADTAVVVVLTLVNGVAEEMFFRGALFDAVPSSLAVPVTSVVYALTTVGSGVLLLVVAALLLGVAAAVLRRRTGGILAPVVLHLTWSAGMLLLLPSVLATGG